MVKIHILNTFQPKQQTERSAPSPLRRYHEMTRNSHVSAPCQCSEPSVVSCNWHSLTCSSCCIDKSSRVTMDLLPVTMVLAKRSMYRIIMKLQHSVHPYETHFYAATCSICLRAGQHNPNVSDIDSFVF